MQFHQTLLCSYILKTGKKKKKKTTHLYIQIKKVLHLYQQIISKHEN